MSSSVIAITAYIPFIMIGLVCLGIGVAVLVLLNRAQDRASAISSLRDLGDESTVSELERDRELLEPLHVRLLAPAVVGASKMGSRVNPPSYVEKVRVKHVQAGIYSQERVERFLAFRLFGFIFAPLWVLMVFTISPFGLTGIMQLVLAGVGVLLGVLGPTVRLDRAVKDRTNTIQRALPDVLDLLTISVEAGLGFEQALDKVIANMPGPLSSEFARVLGETRAGSSRADALRNFQERVDTPEVRSFVLAMIQADTFGVSIGRVLRSQSDEMRVKRRQLAQETAQKAPVKMLLPMVFCIFPSLFAVILGPAFIRIISTL